MIETIMLVTAAIIQKNNLILIAQRKKDTLIEPNKWEFPGGKIEYLEHPEDCLKREIKEELEINISVDKLLTVNSHIYSVNKKNYHIILMAFLCKFIEGELKNVECQDSKWINPSQMGEYDFAAADIPIRDHLLKHMKIDLVPKFS